MYCYVWEFVVHPEHLEAFEAAYGSEGDWVCLFRRDPAYLRTELLRVHDNSTRFLTMDVWTSREACRAFQQRFHAEFADLDRRCEAFTIHEKLIGEYELL